MNATTEPLVLTPEQAQAKAALDRALGHARALKPQAQVQLATQLLAETLEAMQAADPQPLGQMATANATGPNGHCTVLAFYGPGGAFVAGQLELLALGLGAKQQQIQAQLIAMQQQDPAAPAQMRVTVPTEA